MSAIAAMIIAFFAFVALIAFYYYRPKPAQKSVVKSVEVKSNLDRAQLDRLTASRDLMTNKLERSRNYETVRKSAQPVTHRAPPTSSDRHARVTPVERRNDDDMLMNPLHPLNPLNPIYHQDSSPAVCDDNCPAPLHSHSDHGSSSSYDSSSSSSSYDSGSSSSDSSSSSSCD